MEVTIIAPLLCPRCKSSKTRSIDIQKYACEACTFKFKKIFVKEIKE